MHLEGYFLKRLFFLFAGFLLLFSALAVADSSAKGFRGTWLNTTDKGFHFEDKNSYSSDVSLLVNDQIYPKDGLVCDSYYTTFKTVKQPEVLNDNGSIKIPTHTTAIGVNEFGYNCTISLYPGQLTKGDIKNVSLLFNISSSMERMTPGVVQIVSGTKFCRNEANKIVVCPVYDKWDFTDLFASAARYRLTLEDDIFTDSSGQTYYRMLFANWSTDTPEEKDSKIFLDPTISTFSSSQFSSGLFNQTYTNDSQSVFTTWYANNSFAQTGTYYSQILNLNHTFSNILIPNASWAWYEVIGFNTSDFPQLDLHFENDTKAASPYNNSGVIKNATATTLSTLNGQIGGKAVFDGVNGLVNVSYSTSLKFNDTLTLSAWINPNTTNTLGNIISQTLAGSTGSDGGYFLIFNNTAPASRAVTFGVGNGGILASPKWTANNSIPNDGAWHHVVVTYDDAGALEDPAIFVDGINQSLQTVNIGTQPLGTNKYSVTIGLLNDGATWPYNGSIDEVHVWNRSLTSAEVLNLYNWEKGRGLGNNGYIENFTNVSLALRSKSYSFNDTGLIGWWDFGDSTYNELTTNSSLDLAGYGNSFKFYGATTLNTTTCVLGNCLSLDGSSGVAIVTDSLTNTLNDSTFSVWYYVLPQGSGTRGLVQKGGVSGNNVNPFSLALSAATAGTHTITGRVENGTTNIAMAKTGLSNNVWHHAVLIWNSSNLTGSLYMDGVVSAVTQTVPQFNGPNQVTDNIFVGCTTSSQVCSAKTNMTIDIFKIWNRTLSASEISSLYSSGLPVQQTNWSTYTSEQTGGNATNIQSTPAGNLVQYRATFSSQSPNNTAFLQNVTLSYISTFPFYVTLVSPSNYSNVSSVPIRTFTYYLNSTQGNFGNATLYSNFSGTWSANNTNTSALINGSAGTNPINVSGIPQGYFIWNVYACDTDNCSFALNNFTLVVDLTNPLPAILVSPANASNQSSFNVNFTFIPRDATTGVANTTLWIFNSTGTVFNTTLNSSVTNGSQVTNNIILGQQGIYNWTVKSCDYANNCINTTFGNFTVDSGVPLPTILVTPLNSTNTSSSLVNFSFIPMDALTGISNTTLFVFNSTGFPTNTTINTSVTNGSLVTVLLTMPRNDVYNWTVSSCDVVNNCANTSFGNFTIDSVVPIQTVLVSPANSTNQSSLIVNFSFIPADALSGVVNTTLWVFNSTNSVMNTTTNTTVVNGSFVNISLILLRSGIYNWTVQSCDWVGQCINTSFGNIQIDTSAPQPTLLVSPINDSIQGLVVNFSYVPIDDFSLIANTTLFVIRLDNNTYFATITNTTVTNGSMLTNFINLPAFTSYSWTVQVCNIVGSCSNTTFGTFIAPSPAIDTGGGGGSGGTHPVLGVIPSLVGNATTKYGVRSGIVVTPQESAFQFSLGGDMYSGQFELISYLPSTATFKIYTDDPYIQIPNEASYFAMNGNGTVVNISYLYTTPYFAGNYSHTIFVAYTTGNTTQFVAGPNVTLATQIAATSMLKAFTLGGIYSLMRLPVLSIPFVVLFFIVLAFVLAIEFFFIPTKTGFDIAHKIFFVLLFILVIGTQGDVLLHFISQAFVSPVF